MSKQDDFTRVFAWVLGGLVLFTIVVFLLARIFGLEENSGPMTDKDIAERIKPFGGTVVTGGPEQKQAVEKKTETMQPAPAQPMAETTAPAAETVASAANASEPEASAAEAIDGHAIYMQTCQACHAAGVAGAPKLGDKTAWAPRIATGIDALVHSAVNGKGAMPPKGGRLDYSDEQISAAVNYMVSQGQ